jgi:hypothetical protein
MYPELRPCRRFSLRIGNATHQQGNSNNKAVFHNVCFKVFGGVRPSYIKLCQKRKKGYYAGFFLALFKALPAQENPYVSSLSPIGEDTMKKTTKALNGTKEEEFIEVFGAKEHNLKNVDISIPKNKLVVITGISGSGKSSLAFDTIFAEGQRRYMETFGAYARQFMGEMERPDVDKITGLSPVISIEQKTTNKNPRSTVGTVTEIYDFLRLLYARASEAYSYNTGKKMVRWSEDEIVNNIMKRFDGAKISLLAPLVRGRKGHYRELFEEVRKKGFLKVRVDGEIKDLAPKMQVDRYKIMILNWWLTG